ncbi:MAG: heme lyase CcmF/NrfE family subunit [bacterium]
MASLGTFALLGALVVALYGIAAGILGLRRGDTVLLTAAHRSVTAWAGFIALASGALLFALLGRDFSIRYVAETTNRSLPLIYTISAFWGGHAGSLLLWALVLGVYGVAATQGLRRAPGLAPYVTLVLLSTAAFFTATLAFSSNPFATLQVPPPDGRGLNPILRNPWMAVHPPALYLGFVGMTVPFALAMASLLSGSADQAWLALARRWVLTAWVFLTLGLLFGAKWSYVVLGWGGYWAWDPVENAALMPWLTSTAFLHSIQITQRTGLLAGWTTALMLVSFALSILGTFLTRSGVLSSVHAFADSTVGLYFLIFLGVSVLVSFGLLLWRGRSVPRGDPVESVLSREAAFLANNVLLVVAAAAVLFGTLFPIFAEAATGDRINVGPPYFNQVMVPIVLILLALMAVGPLLSWRRADPGELAGILAAPAAGGLLVAAAAAALGIRNGPVLLLAALCAFVAGTIVLEFARGVRVRRMHREGLPIALIRLVDRNRRRYGGYIVHFGILVMLVGITASSVFSTQTQATLPPGGRVRIGRYELRYEDAQGFRGPDLRMTAAHLTAFDGSSSTRLAPRHIYHEAQDEITADVAIRSTWRDDLYVVLIGLSESRVATFRVLINPMVQWLWTGALVIVLGGLIAAWPPRPRQEAERAAHVEQAAVAAGGPAG